MLMGAQNLPGWIQNSRVAIWAHTKCFHRTQESHKHAWLWELGRQNGQGYNDKTPFHTFVRLVQSKKASLLFFFFNATLPPTKVLGLGLLAAAWEIPGRFGDGTCGWWHLRRGRNSVGFNAINSTLPSYHFLQGNRSLFVWWSLIFPGDL